MRVISVRIIAARAFDLGIQALIVLSLVAFSIDTLPDLHPAFRQRLQIAEVLTVAVFSVEYVLRLSAAGPMRSYAFSFFGLVDLAAILPFHIALGLDFQSLRAVCLFRLFRRLQAVSLQRYDRARQPCVLDRSGGADPERLRPTTTRQSLAERVSASFTAAITLRVTWKDLVHERTGLSVLCGGSAGTAFSQ